MKQKKAVKVSSTKKKSITGIKEVDKYINDISSGKIHACRETKQQVCIIINEFKKEKIELNTYLYDKYLKIGYLFFNELFPFQCFAMAVCLCTFYKGTSRARWNKVLLEMGRGNGKDSLIAWFSCCLTSEYHGIKHYDVDIIANNMDQSLRPLQDIVDMTKEKNKKSFFSKTGDSIFVSATDSFINARSSDAKMQDGLRSGCVIFNEVHGYESYSKLNIMISGLGKVEDPRTFYFTTNGDVRGAVLDDMLDTAKDVLDGINDDKRFLYLIYKIDKKEEAHNPKLWVKANPIIEYRQTLMDEVLDEYDIWKRNPSNLPAFIQKRMNLPESSLEQEVVPWEIILKTKQAYPISKLKGRSAVLGIDASKTTDWTAVNLLFYDSEIDKYICVNHAFICGKNRDLPGIKAPYLDWCKEGYGDVINAKEVSPEIPVSWAMNFARENDIEIVTAVIDNFKKGIFSSELEKHGYSKEQENLVIVTPRNIAETVPLIERAFINERLIWGNNNMLRWATNNCKTIPWKRTKTTGDNDLGNQLYAKINPRFRKTDPFMAFVHSFIKVSDIEEQVVEDSDFVDRGF